MTVADVPDRDLGELQEHDGKPTLRFVRRFPHPVDKVWRAITEAEHVAAWFPCTIEGDFVAGGKLRFVFEEPGVDPIEGEMYAFDPPSLMEFSWGEDVLRFELRADGDGTVLDFSDTIVEYGKAARDGAGWHTCFDLLAHEVDGTAAPFTSVERWSQVHGTYKQRMGAEASALGPPEEWERAHGAEAEAAGDR
jgi:uncharacterized protein YndB with AHSA1/START domain